MVKVVDRVNASMDRPGTLGSPWTDGGADRGCQSVVARSPKYGLRPLRCTKAHRRGRNRERGARGARFGPHRRRRRSLRGRLERGEKRREAGRGAANSGAWCSPFIGVRGALGRGARGGGRVNAGVNGFNAIEDGGGFKRGIKGGKMNAGW
jgi:hypothetical protein